MVLSDIKVLGSDECIKMGIFDDTVIGTIIWNVDAVILGIDAGTELGSLDGSFDDPNDGNIEVLLLGDSLESTNGKGLGSGEVVWFSLSFTN